MTKHACEYFVACGRPASVAIRDPIIGDIPTCARCNARMLPGGDLTPPHDPDTRPRVPLSPTPTPKD